MIDYDDFILLPNCRVLGGFTVKEQCSWFKNVISFAIGRKLVYLFICLHAGQMWSTADAGQSSALLMLGGGSESEGEGPGPGGAKSQLIETSIISPQDEDVELLAQPQQ